MGIPAFSDDLVDELTAILERVARDINLEALAVITRTGRKIAFWSAHHKVDPDILAALSAAMVSMGDETCDKLESGDLYEVIVRGRRGYAITTSAGPKLALIGASYEGENLGLIVRIMRDAAAKIATALGYG
ncbi:MAG: roadblock/LC7 domain-containing protein [Candidatus Ranarchaeia archaeon]